MFEGKWVQVGYCTMRAAPSRLSEGPAIFKNVVEIMAASKGESGLARRSESTMDWGALFLTLKLDLVVCGILLLIGIPIAVWLASSQWHWKFLLEAVVALPLVLPPTVL